MVGDYDDEEESEDESFKEDGGESLDEEESGEVEDEGSDVQMIDSDVDKKELKALQKEAGNIDLKGGRPKRAQRK